LPILNSQSIMGLILIPGMVIFTKEFNNRWLVKY
jgi:hypothetical protein